MRLIIIILLFLSIKGFSQEANPKIDSLKNVFASAKEDSVKARALYEWNEIIIASDPQLAQTLNEKLDSICDLHEEFLDEQEKNFYWLMKASVYESFGFLELDRQNHDNSIRHYLSAASLYQKLNMMEDYASAHTFVGYNYFRMDELDSSLAFYEPVLKLSSEQEFYTSLTASYNGIGQVLRKKKKYQEALAFFQRSIDINDSLQIENGNRVPYHTTGEVYLDMHDYKKAADYLEKSLEIKLRMNHVRGLKNSYLSLSDLYFKMGDLKKSKEYGDKVIDLEVQLGDSIGIYDIYYDTGVHLKLQANWSEATEYFEKARDFAIVMGDKQREARACSRLGWTNFRVANYEKGLQYYGHEYELEKELGNISEMSSARMKMAQANKFLKNFERAIELSNEAVQMIDTTADWKQRAYIFSEQASMYGYMNNKKKADELFKKSLRISEEHGDTLTVGYWYRRSNQVAKNKQNYLSDEARYIHHRLLVAAKEAGDARLLGAAYQRLFYLNKNSDQADSARKYLNMIVQSKVNQIRANFSRMTESEKEKYFAITSPILYKTYDIADQLGEKLPVLKSDAYDAALLLKGLLLKSSTEVRTSVLESGDSALIDKYHHWLGLQNGISELLSLGEDASHLEIQALEIEKELVLSSSTFNEMRDAQNVNWTDVRDALETEECAIEFVKYKSQKRHVYAALILKKDSELPEIVHLCDESELIDVLGLYPGTNRSYIEHLYGTNEDPHSQLYNLIWKPLEGSLGGITKVYISPVGLLHKISFAALSDDKGKLLTNKYEVDLLSSTSKIVHGKTSHDMTLMPITLFGGIDYTSDTSSVEVWSYLEGSFEEAEEISHIVDNKQREIHFYSHKDATEKKFKETAPQSAIVHVATHGYFYTDDKNLLIESVDEDESDEELVFRGTDARQGIKNFIKTDNPLMRSGLIFANANDIWKLSADHQPDEIDHEDGILTAHEVATLDLRKTELVVLSACETGLGDIHGSEGVYGLQRSFKIAGAKYLIMSLWQVPDKETAEFMESFYNYLNITGEVKKAFDLAQQRMMKEYDPYFWAAFVLVE